MQRNNEAIHHGGTQTAASAATAGNGSSSSSSSSNSSSSSTTTGGGVGGNVRVMSGSTNNALLTAQELQSAFLLGQERGGELTQDLLQTQGWTKEKIVAVFNRLTEARAGVIRRNGNEISCALRPASIIAKLKTLDAFDYKIYCAIELAGSTGVWTADLRKSTGLQTHVIQRSVKQLCEMLKLIKPVKSIHVKNRKMYILSHLEPSKEIAGGSFYSNGEFNEPVVEVRSADLLPKQFPSVCISSSVERRLLEAEISPV